jgi:hypothetical protein
MTTIPAANPFERRRRKSRKFKANAPVKKKRISLLKKKKKKKRKKWAKRKPASLRKLTIRYKLSQYKKTIKQERLEKSQDRDFNLIYELYIKTAMILKPDQLEDEEWLGWIFGVADRPIDSYKAMATFEMLGRQMLCPTKGVYNTINRTVKRGTILWVRFDKMFPDEIDVEVMVNDEYHLFKLTKHQFEDINIFLRKISSDSLESGHRDVL